jgi:hypothetical protein
LGSLPEAKCNRFLPPKIANGRLCGSSCRSASADPAARSHDATTYKMRTPAPRPHRRLCRSAASTCGARLT